MSHHIAMRTRFGTECFLSYYRYYRIRNICILSINRRKPWYSYEQGQVFTLGNTTISVGTDTFYKLCTVDQSYSVQYTVCTLYSRPVNVGIFSPCGNQTPAPQDLPPRSLDYRRVPYIGLPAPNCTLLKGTVSRDL